MRRPPHDRSVVGNSRVESARCVHARERCFGESRCAAVPADERIQRSPARNGLGGCDRPVVACALLADARARCPAYRAISPGLVVACPPPTLRDTRAPWPTAAASSTTAIRKCLKFREFQPLVRSVYLGCHPAAAADLNPAQCQIIVAARTNLGDRHFMEPLELQRVTAIRGTQEPPLRAFRYSAYPITVAPYERFVNNSPKHSLRPMGLARRASDKRRIRRIRASASDGMLTVCESKPPTAASTRASWVSHHPAGEVCVPPSRVAIRCRASRCSDALGTRWHAGQCIAVATITRVPLYLLGGAMGWNACRCVPPQNGRSLAGGCDVRSPFNPTPCQ